MTDILNFLRAYPDDAAAVMSKARVAETIAEIERLTAELAACKEQENAEWVKAIAERDAMRELLREARERLPEHVCARIAAALNKGDRDE